MSACSRAEAMFRHSICRLTTAPDSGLGGSATAGQTPSARGAKRQPGSPTHAACASVGVGQRSVNRAQHAVPAGSRGYFNQGTQDANQTAPEGTFAVFLFGTLNGPVNQHGPAHNRLAIDEAPVAAVPAVVPIVSHGEIVAGRNHDFSILNVLENLIGPFRLHAGN